jgi:hypothetical protein
MRWEKKRKMTRSTYEPLGAVEVALMALEAESDNPTVVALPVMLETETSVVVVVAVSDNDTVVTPLDPGTETLTIVEVEDPEVAVPVVAVVEVPGEPPMQLVSAAGEGLSHWLMESLRWIRLTPSIDGELCRPSSILGTVAEVEYHGSAYYIVGKR